jgi:hypothetical protein
MLPFVPTREGKLKVFYSGKLMECGSELNRVKKSWEKFYSKELFNF